MVIIMMKGSDEGARRMCECDIANVNGTSSIEMRTKRRQGKG